MKLEKLVEISDRGHKYVNKTQIYLSHCMEWYGEDIIQTINGLNCVWCGIDLVLNYSIDYIFNWSNQGKVHVSLNKIIVEEHSLANTNLYLYSLRVPKAMHQAYDKFLQSKYSEMYTREQLEQIFIKADPRFGNKDIKDLALPTLIKHPKRKEKFEDVINSWSKDDFAERIILPDNAELDTIWKHEHEILEL